jgi:hypothetical protein
MLRVSGWRMGHQPGTRGIAAHSGGAWCGLKSRAVAKKKRRAAKQRLGEQKGVQGVKKSTFASEPRRAEDKDARGGTHGRPRRSSGHRRVAEQLAHVREANDWAVG